MNREQMIQTIHTEPYSFLCDNPHLGDNIILLGLGGSHAYGTNTEASDLDIRGIAVNTAEAILSDDRFEQVVDNGTDTTIYSFDKIISLFSACNPNTIEILGLRPSEILYLSPLGEGIFANKTAFLSRRAIHSFGGYASAQLRRLENKSARNFTQPEMEEFILASIRNASVSFKDKYFEMPDDSIKLYIDASLHEELDSEIFMDVNLHHYPLRDYKNMWSDMNAIVKAYAATGHRNTQAIMHSKIAKHMMHLVRLYLMCFDILENGEIVTYREKDHDFLMDIRNGKYIDENDKPTKEFYDILDELEHKFEVLKQTNNLPDKPDAKRIKKIICEVNQHIIDVSKSNGKFVSGFKEWYYGT